jgi:outer membrane biogenesis lipoprotein LolB
MVALDRADAHLLDQPGGPPRRYVREVEDMAFDQLCEGDDSPLLSLEDWYAGLDDREADERLETERAS